MIKSIYIIVIALFCFSNYGLFAQNPAGSNDNNAAEARKHFNKAKVFVENASTEKEWELAINELEQVIKYAPNNDKAYLMLGDAYSHIMTNEAIQQAQKHWSKYVELVPSSKNEIEEKVATLEAMYEVNQSEKQDEIIESLLGRWSRTPSKEFWMDMCDIEIFRVGDEVMVRYISDFYDHYWFSKPNVTTSVNKASLEGSCIVIKYERTNTKLWEGDNGSAEGVKWVTKSSIYISRPAVEGMITVREIKSIINDDGSSYKAAEPEWDLHKKQ